MWCGSLPALSRKGRGLSHTRTPTKRARKAGADAAAQGGNAPTAEAKARMGSLEVVLARRKVVVAEVVSWSFGAKKRAFSTSSDLESARGRAPSVRSNVRKYGRSGANGHQGWIETETLT